MRLNNLWSFCTFLKCLSSKFKIFLPIFIETIRPIFIASWVIFIFLKRYIYLLQFLVLFISLDMSFSCWNVILCLNPLSANELLYKSLESLNVILWWIVNSFRYIAWKILNYILRILRKNVDNSIVDIWWNIIWFIIGLIRNVYQEPDTYT